MSWKEIIKITTRDLEDEGKDELCKTIVQLDDIDDINVYKLKKLFRITQDILKFKYEQVDLLMIEFDEIARKQGIEDAKVIHSLENEIKSLRSSSESRLHTPEKEVVKENDYLKVKLKTLKTALKSQTQEIEQLKSDILNIQEEKNILQSELMHSTNRDSDSQSELSDISEKHKHLTDNLKQKNKQISQLLSDVEFIEKENISLKEKTISLKNELHEATEHITNMTTEISSHKKNLTEINEKINTLSKENTALRNQIEELVQQKQDHETELDNFTSTLDHKIDELKKLLEEKQTEIKELKYENVTLQRKVIEISNINKVPTKILEEKDEQIEELESKLIEATQEIEKNTTLLNNIAASRKQHVTDIEHDSITDDLKSQLLAAHERCQELQTLLEATEKDAQDQGQQLTELLNQLRKYEEGQYGLPDALREMQELRVQINVRDKQISELIQTCNKYQTTCDEIEYENLALREKCGLPADAQISKTAVISKQRKQKKLINNLQNQIEVLEDEKLQLKVNLQNLKRKATASKTNGELNKKTDESDSSAFDYKKKYTDVSEENEALRKGLHEILDCVRTKKDTSDKEIKSETLEKLLHILDARHVTGWYHPAMKLQTEVHILQGTNEELRNQLKLAKIEVNEMNEQLQKNELKLHDLQLNNNTAENTSQSLSLMVPPNISLTSSDIISKLNSHLLVVLNEYNMEVENSESLKETLEKYKQEMNVVKQQITLLYQQFSSEKNALKTKYEDLLSEKENLSTTLQNLQSKLEDYLKTSAPTNTDSSTFCQKLSNDFITMNRKCLFLEENEKRLTTENSQLKLDLSEAQASYTKRINDCNIERNNLSQQLHILENTLRESVPKSKLEKANTTIYDLTVKQRELLQNTNCFKESNNIVLYKKQIELLNSEKDHLFSQLLQLKIKKLNVDHANDNVTDLTKKLATFELNCSSERQRADHVNSLYELVKEQLKKCEERCMEYENQNKILINNNLKIQLNQQEFQDKLLKCVSQEDHQIVLNKLQTAQDELNKTRNKYSKLQTRYKLIENEMKTHEMFKASQNLELMNLKHLLLDLQSTSDEKALIARLSTEVVLARICESDSKNQIDILTSELKQMNEQLQQKEIDLTESNEKLNNIQNQYQTKLMIMEQILCTLRSQYLGYNPLYSQERIIDIFHQIYKDKQFAFNELQVMQKQKNDIILLQEQLNLELNNTKELKAVFLKENYSKNEKLLEWYKDKHILKVNELKYRRNLEIKDEELNLALKRIKYQDKELLQLDEELVRTSANILNNLFITNNSQYQYQQESTDTVDNKADRKKQLVDTGVDPLTPKTVIHNTIEIQTVPDEENKILIERISCFENDIQQMKQLIALKDTNLQQQESIIADYEKNIEALNEKIREKETQIKTTESNSRESRNQVNVIDEVDMNEHNALKQMVTKLQMMISQKEELILKYEALLKEGKDAHSLAAIRFQEEIKHLQNQLQVQQTAYQELKESVTKANTKQDVVPNRSAIEQYVSQVHVLEGHMAELETSVSSLNSQLHASRQECVRWRTLANDRLNSIETLRKEFEEQQQQEILTYKNEYEKYKEENITIKHELSKVRVELNQIGLKHGQEIQARDTKIHELTMEMTQLKNELKMHEEGEKLEADIELTDLQLAKQVLETEHVGLKKRYNNLMEREKSARDEVKNLRKQLMNRPSLSVRNVRSDKCVKEQLQKKIATLEQELNEANEKLEKDAMLNSARRAKIAEDFTYWEKQKRLQQMADKTKEKLASKVEELEKMQHSYTSAKAIISRLEREKHVLEGKLKYAKSLPGTLSLNRVESAEQQNKILKNEIEMLNKKLEMQQHHSGGLGAAMLQEKLEAQERKIAILELSTKGSVEITAELERMNNAIANYQKINLRLEAENLDLSVNLKKTASNVPFLREQIQHLERYISVLKSEQAENHVVTNSGDQLLHGNKIVQLEKTVVSLKNLVEKLQAENKRLHEKSSTSTSNPNSERKPQKGALEKSQLELKRVREQYTQSMQKTSQLEDELSRSQKRIRYLEQACEATRVESESSLSTELNDVKEQLARKSQLLDKVKILLQKAALKEKFLEDQIEQLKTQNATNPEPN